MEADISIWQKSGHFYFALTPQCPDPIPYRDQDTDLDRSKFATVPASAPPVTPVLRSPLVRDGRSVLVDSEKRSGTDIPVCPRYFR
jgi:hypothetical protein